MNTPTTPATPDTAQEAAHLKKLRDQISTDIEAMQQKEASLKEYEQRLRLLMEHNQQGQPARRPTSISSPPAPTASRRSMRNGKNTTGPMPCSRRPAAA